MELGWDRERGVSKEKHYRRWFNKPLEEVEDIFPGSPFDEETIKRGQTRGADDDSMFGSWGRMFSKVKFDDAGEVDTEKDVGSFKGLVTVSTEAYEEIYNRTKNKYIMKIYDELAILYESEKRIELKRKEKEGKGKFSAKACEFPFDRSKFNMQAR